jgi:hypothetical protein
MVTRKLLFFLYSNKEKREIVFAGEDQEAKERERIGK